MLIMSIVSFMDENMNDLQCSTVIDLKIRWIAGNPITLY